MQKTTWLELRHHRRAISALSTSVDRDLYSRINEQYQYLAATVPFGTSLALSIQTVTQSTVNKSNSYGANALGIAAQPQICKWILSN